ncbi:hypothetical protein ACFL23_00140 [Patescibacteria group bacterium]
MKKQFTMLATLTFILLLIPFNFSNAQNISSRLKGKILLQVEDKGQGWYIDPDTQERAYLGRPADAFKIMQELGLGIKHIELEKYLNSSFPERLAGKILLDVESKGEAYYVYPEDLKGYYLSRPNEAFRIMREKGLGITNKDLNKVPIFQKYKEQIYESVAEEPKKKIITPIIKPIPEPTPVLTPKPIIKPILTTKPTSQPTVAPTPEPTPTVSIIEPKSDRDKIIEIFRAEALAQWGNDYEMVNYEVENQTEAYDWIVKQTAYPAIMTKAKQEWDNDYGMIKYEYENQVEDYEWINRQTAYPAIMTRAKQEWSNDYGMVKYEYENQVEDYEWINKQTAYPEIMERAKQEWGNDYGMVKYEYENNI